MFAALIYNLGANLAAALHKRMDNHLAHHDYFAAGHFTVADIALYAYTHLAHLCDFDLAGFPAIIQWLARIEREPGYVPMGAALPATAEAVSG